jgi:hypothetical protein
MFRRTNSGGFRGFPIDTAHQVYSPAPGEETGDDSLRSSRAIGEASNEQCVFQMLTQMVGLLDVIWSFGLYSESNFLGVPKFDPYQYCQYLTITN